MVSQLQDLGFEKAAQVVQARHAACEKWAEAYARYRYVTPEQIDGFKRNLSSHVSPSGSYYELALVPIQRYSEVPPAAALEALKEAKETGLFAEFEIAYLQARVRVPDPILFGRIEGCPDYFVIAEWGDDVSYADLVKKEK